MRAGQLSAAQELRQMIDRSHFESAASDRMDAKQQRGRAERTPREEGYRAIDLPLDRAADRVRRALAPEILPQRDTSWRIALKQDRHPLLPSS